MLSLFPLIGPESQFRGHDSGQDLNELTLALGVVALAGGEAFNLRLQGTETGPQLIAGGAGLEVVGIP